MKWILYLLLTAILFVIPVERTDVGKLEPVELLWLHRNRDVLVLETDIGNVGRGIDTMQAVEDLHDAAAGILYLDTAEYLLIAPDCMDEIGEMERYLRGNVRMCVAEDCPDAVLAAEYLDIHHPKTEIENYNGEQIGEKLVIRDGQYHLEAENEKK